MSMTILSISVVSYGAHAARFTQDCQARHRVGNCTIVSIDSEVLFSSESFLNFFIYIFVACKKPITAGMTEVEDGSIAL